MIKATDYWNQRAPGFDDMIERVYKQTHADTINKIKAYLNQQDRVLDFACGTGTISIGIADQVAEVHAIDISGEMVRLTQEKLEKLGIKNVEVLQKELFDENLRPDSFDVVVAANVLCYLEHWDQEMERIRSLLKSGGLFLSATDCLREEITGISIKKFVKVHTGKMPYEKFFTMDGLEKKIAGEDFAVLERENLHNAPPNLFIAARK